MSGQPDPGPAPSERVKDTAGITRALRQAVREALREHKRLGNPIAVWRDGRVVELPPEEIPDWPDEDEDPDEAAEAG